ncbi:MAG: hypothetical protein WAN03_12080, partial [Candidatus Sulfotelmatobacter sp.]
MSRMKRRFHIPPRSTVRGLILAGLILSIQALCFAQASFTLEQVLSSPFPSELTSAAHDNRVAWVVDARGMRNVWVADAPDFARTARQVT